MRIRDGRAESVPLLADPPFGVPRSGGYRIQRLALEAGDRLMFLTDGMLERNAADVDVLSVLVASRHLHPREAVQELTRTVVDACGGALRDDATVLCLDYHGLHRDGDPRPAGPDSLSGLTGAGPT